MTLLPFSKRVRRRGARASAPDSVPSGAGAGDAPAIETAEPAKPDDDLFDRRIAEWSEALGTEAEAPQDRVSAG